MKVTILAPIFGAAMVAGMASAGAAGAVTMETFNLSIDGCSSSCFGTGVTSVGTVTVTQTAAGALDFAVKLSNGALVNANGNQEHHALAFSVGGTGVSGVAIGNLTTGFAGTTSSSPTFDDSPFATGKVGKTTNLFWDVIDYTGTASQGSTPSSFSFVVTDSGKNLTLGDLSPVSYTVNEGITQVYLAADVFANKNTGNVGAPGGTISIGTPEPGSWALMVIGVGLMGASLRSRRRSILALAPARR